MSITLSHLACACKGACRVQARHGGLHMGNRILRHRFHLDRNPVSIANCIKDCQDRGHILRPGRGRRQIGFTDMHMRQAPARPFDNTG
jgi:hypothetical protein